MSKIKVKIKKVDKGAIIPSYAKEGDAGLDLTASSIKEGSGDMISYGTGIAIGLPANHVGLIFPRSSLSNYDLSLANSVGVIDSGFSGEISLRFKKLKTDAKIYAIGDRIGQLIVLPYNLVEFEEVEELDKTARGDGSYGSSGK